MSNWEKQIEEHCVRGALSSCVYYGATRSLSPQELMKYDVVITTYQVCSFFALTGLTSLTCHQTVAGEHAEAGNIKNGGEGPSKKKKKIAQGLFNVQWKVCFDAYPSYKAPMFIFDLGSQRIILDEGHSIRNPRTKMAKAVCTLSAQRRWVLSGTPIVRQQ